MVGIQNATNTTLQNITNIINITNDPTEFLINVNHTVYGGWLFFLLLIVAGILLFRKAQEKQDQPLINIMYITAALTIVSFFMRAIYVIRGGVPIGLLTDFQLWIFPLAAAISALMVRFSSA